MRAPRRCWTALLVLGLLSPLGLLLPALVGASGAWGEWGRAEVLALVGYLPAGMARTAGIWTAPLAGYAVPRWGQASPGSGYMLSAFLGMAGCIGGAYVLGRWLSRGRR